MALRFRWDLTSGMKTVLTFCCLAIEEDSLRFGVELLKTASVSGQANQPQEINADIEYLIAETSGFYDFFHFVMR